MNSKSVVGIAERYVKPGAVIWTDIDHKNAQVPLEDFKKLCRAILQINELAQKSSHAALAAIREVLK